MFKPEPIQVEAADPVGGNLIVYFSDGTSVLYDAQLLFASRYTPGNVVLADLPDNEPSAQ